MNVTKEEIAGSIANLKNATVELRRAHAAYIRAFARRLQSRTEKNYVAEHAAQSRLNAAARAVTEATVF